jgi:glycine cleavage system protein P-like pyridoxal-binding family
MIGRLACPDSLKRIRRLPIEAVQGCLEVLYSIQEWFKKITGLAAVTTQPLAGAQGELVGLKLFPSLSS